MGLAEGGRANFNMGGGAVHDARTNNRSIQKQNQCQKKLHQQETVYLTKN